MNGIFMAKRDYQLALYDYPSQQLLEQRIARQRSSAANLFFILLTMNTRIRFLLLWLLRCFIYTTVISERQYKKI